MFKVFKSFADFKGCTERQHLWCFDCWTKDNQNRRWVVSDLSARTVEKRANEYAVDHFADLVEVTFFDPCYTNPDIDYMGNFPWWYRDNKDKFMLACKIESVIPSGTSKWESATRDALRDVACDILRNEPDLHANIGEIEDMVMYDIIRDVLRA